MKGIMLKGEKLCLSRLDLRRPQVSSSNFGSVWYCVCTCVSSKFKFFFFLLKLSAVCTFWIVLMC
jgi:hypothetical protein